MSTKTIHVKTKHNWKLFFFILCTSLVSQNGQTTEQVAQSFEKTCLEELRKFPGGGIEEKYLIKACSVVTVKKDCYSVEGSPIFQYDKKSKEPLAKSILVFSMIHGDELHAGTVARYWMQRLESIDPRNTWRVLPILNPDGTKLKTRTNANKIDLNRNFPTKDWNDLAQGFWKKNGGGSPRRFPGIAPASEPETRCALQQIEEFNPDFIVSVHTPLKVLDYDGPKLPVPKFDYLPWKSLGHFPGSLGRYMWFERQTPVLTMELRENLPTNLAAFEKLQDIIGELVKVNIKKTTKNKGSEVSQFYLNTREEH